MPAASELAATVRLVVPVAPEALRVSVPNAVLAAKNATVPAGATDPLAAFTVAVSTVVPDAETLAGLAARVTVAATAACVTVTATLPVEPPKFAELV